MATPSLTHGLRDGDRCYQLANSDYFRLQYSFSTLSTRTGIVSLIELLPPNY